MKKIQILGTGCPKCNMLKENAEKAVKDLGIEAEIEKVSDIRKIMEMGVMSTPAIAVDGKVISSGKVLKPEEIKKFIG
jgi:small redox-active disulfide protein 2